MAWMDVMLTLATSYCVYTDIKNRKIRNYITFPLMGIGIIYNVYLNGLDGLLFSLKGLFISGILAAFLFAFKGLGMGDVKLFMGIGSIKGSVFTASVLVFSLFSSIILSFLINPKRFIKAVRNVYEMVKGVLYRNPYLLTEKDSALTVAYAVHIMVGLIITYMFGGDFLWGK